MRGGRSLVLVDNGYVLPYVVVLGMANNQQWQVVSAIYISLGLDA